MLSHETILKSKDTEKCMTQILGFNRKLYRQVFLENSTEKQK